MINTHTYVLMVDSLVEDSNTIDKSFKYYIDILYDLFSKGLVQPSVLLK